MTSKPTNTTLRSGKSLPKQSIRNENQDVNRIMNTNMEAQNNKENNQLSDITNTNKDNLKIISESIDTTNDRDNKPYPNHSDDPDPISSDSPKGKMATYKNELKEYTNSMYVVYSKSKMRGEMLWQDFITAFRPHTMRSWTRSEVFEWRDLLIQKGIYVEPDRSRPPVEAIVDILYRDEHIGIRKEDIKFNLDNFPNNGRDTEKKQQLDKTKSISGMDESPQMAATDNKTDNKIPDKEKERMTSNNPDDDDESSSEDDNDEGNKLNNNSETIERNRKTHDNHITSIHTNPESNGWNSEGQRGRGVTTIIRAYAGQPTFSGTYDDDLEGIVELYSDTADNCDATPEEKRKAMFIMLKGNARSLFARKGRSCITFEDGVELIRTWYNSSDKESRLLSEWHSMSLSEAIRDNPDESEVSTFRSFVDKLMSLQHQLHKDYHTDRYLRDRLMTAVDIKEINDSLKDRVPRNAHQLVNRVANRLSSRKGSSSKIPSMYLVQDENKDDLKYEKGEAMYTTGQKYGGEAKGNIKRYGQYGYKPGRNPSHRQKTYNKTDTHNRRLSTNWLRSVKGCFVCKKDHYAREKHSREEISAAIEKLKAQHPKALITVEDAAYLYNDQTSDDDTDIRAEWAEDETEDEDEDGILALLADGDIKDIERKLSNSAFIHGTMTWRNKNEAIEAMHSNLITGYHDYHNNYNRFKGIRIDTCCNIRSIISLDQYKAYCRDFGLNIALKPPTGKAIIGIGGIQIPVGAAMIQIPFKKLNLIIDVNFVVIKDSVPTLLSMKDMIRNGLDISIQHKYISFNNKRQGLKLVNYFLIHQWCPGDNSYALYTETELKKIHKTFGHPTINALEGLLKRANEGNLDTETRLTIQKITDECKPCAIYAKAPKRFKLTVGTSDLRFNHSVQVDTMFIDSKPVLHMVDLATHFSAAAFLRNQSSAEVWRTIQGLWNLVYVGPPDHITVDQGSNYVSKEMRQNLEAAGVVLHEAPVENPGTIGTVERYHGPLRVAYNKIRIDLGKEVTNAECLRMAVFSVNSTMGPEGLCPILLVFGVIPRPARSTPSITQVERSKAIEGAMIEVEKEHARRRIAFGLRTKGGPEITNPSKELRNLPAGANVMVYRPKLKRWDGPYRFISIEGETVVVQSTYGRSIFRSSCVKPYIKSHLSNEYSDEEKGTNVHGSNITREESTNAMYTSEGKESRHEIRNDKTNNTTNKEKPNIEFAQSRRDELIGLLENGTFEIINMENIPEGARVFGSRFIDAIKKAGQGLRKKSRLVAQNYSDEAAASIATRAPTIQRSSQRLLLSMAASVPNLTTFTRDITQAYIQSDRDLERAVYIRAPAEMDLTKGTVLKVIRPLYGIPESGLHWYLTYLDHHVQQLGMTRSKIDPCVLMRHNVSGELEGLINLQVDDSLGIGTLEFLKDEESAAHNFKAKPRTMLKTTPLNFNGSDITMQEDGSIKMSQVDKIDKLVVPNDEAGFKSQRAMIQYIGVNCRPDVCASVQLIAPGSEQVTAEEFKILKKTINHLRKTNTTGLTYKRLDLTTTKLVVITDASFANARGLKSQLGFVILMRDDKGVTNIIHYGSSRCKRVTKSVMASEVHALLLGFDNAFVLRTMMEEILQRKVEIEAYVDSKTVFDIIAKDGRTTEKRLQIDIFSLRESYENGELSKMGWIPGNANPADPLTKQLVNTKTSLWRMMQECKIELDPVGWSSVAHKGKSLECGNVTELQVCDQTDESSIHDDVS